MQYVSPCRSPAKKEHCIFDRHIPCFSPMPKHARMISASPSTDLSAVEARQFAWALWRQSPSAASKLSLTSTSVLRPPTTSPSFRLAPQTPTSTPHSTHEDKHVFSSLWTPTALTDQAKEAVAMEAGYGIHRIGEVSVYALHGTPQDKLTMENVVHGGKIASTVQLGPVHSTHTRCVIRSKSFLLVTPISLSPLTQVTLIFLPKSCPKGWS
jgi:hypothetical protein